MAGEGEGQDVLATELLLDGGECPGTDSFLMGSVIGAFSLPSSLFLSLLLSLSPSAHLIWFSLSHSAL